MFKKVFFGFLLFSFSLPLPLIFAAGTPLQPEFSELLHQADDLAKKGDWNRSENTFLQATQSPILDDRIQAYQGLESLYKRLRLAKKARLAKKI